MYVVGIKNLIQVKPFLLVVYMVCSMQVSFGSILFGELKSPLVHVGQYRGACAVIMRNCQMPIITHIRQIYVAQCRTEILNTVKVEPTFWHAVFPLGASDDNGCA